MLMSPALAQRFENSATDAEYDALLRASDAAAQPSPHPDQFRFLMFVMLPKIDMPVPVVGLFGIDNYGVPALDGAWVYLPGHPASWISPRSDRFCRIRREAIGEHWNDLLARAAEQREVHPLAA